ncbi:MAG: hypothetical protein EOO54_19060 [Haliea sp.]|nr:MAG: hypothetical protein EOO54_19060 [Haliea sp.]
MKTHHSPRQWTTAALVAAAAWLPMTGAVAQTGADAVFQGRPSMAGAQAGQGAMAGPPQGGIGLQGSEGTGLTLRRPAIVDAPPANMPQGKMEDPPAEPSASDKMERAAKRTSEGQRYGVSPLDTR